MKVSLVIKSYSLIQLGLHFEYFILVKIHSLESVHYYNTDSPILPVISMPTKLTYWYCSTTNTEEDQGIVIPLHDIGYSIYTELHTAVGSGYDIPSIQPG